MKREKEENHFLADARILVDLLAGAAATFLVAFFAGDFERLAETFLDAFFALLVISLVLQQKITVVV